MMNPRGGYTGYRSSGYNPVRGRQPVRSTSINLPSNFQPVTEWKEEDAALVLLVYLPGFLKEQVRVTADELISYIRVFGERILTSNMRSRFNTAYNVPKNCDLSQMKSEFASGILTIRIPKIIPAVKSTEPGELEAETSQGDPRPEDTTGKPKPEKNGEETPSGRTSTTFGKETEGKDVEALSPRKAASKSVSQKGQDEAPQKGDLLVNTTKQIEEKTAGSGVADQNLTEKKEKNEAIEKPVEEEKPEKVAEKPSVKEEEKDEKSQEPKIAESVIMKKEEEGEKESAVSDDKEKSNKEISEELKDTENARASANKSDKDVDMEEPKIAESVVLKKEEEEKNEGADGDDKEKPNKDISKEFKDTGNARASAKMSDKDVDMEEPKIAESVVLKKGEEEKHERAAGDDKEKPNKEISEELKDTEKARASANISDKEVDRKNEENQLIVNICVAVSIIMAIGAYFYSIFSSSSKI